MAKKNIIYQVDAFTGVPFKGNPAGVMIVNNKMKAARMQEIASEMNLSETAFVIPDGRNFKIRYFTPAREVSLCGHATLASAHVIYSIGMCKPGGTIHFKAKGGMLSVINDNNWITMNFPVYPLKKAAPPANFKTIVGFKPIEMFLSSYDWVVAIARSDNEVLSANPDFEALKASGLGHMLITAKSIRKGIDFSVRCFAPSLGVNEDPVTGSAQCALTPLWNMKTGKTVFNVLQLSKRGGRLRTALVDDRVLISGKAVIVLKADMLA